MLIYFPIVDLPKVELNVGPRAAASRRTGSHERCPTGARPNVTEQTKECAEAITVVAYRIVIRYMQQRVNIREKKGL